MSARQDLELLKQQLAAKQRQEEEDVRRRAEEQRLLDEARRQKEGRGMEVEEHAAGLDEFFLFERVESGETPAYHSSERGSLTFLVSSASSESPHAHTVRERSVQVLTCGMNDAEEVSPVDVSAMIADLGVASPTQVPPFANIFGINAPDLCASSNRRSPSACSGSSHRSCRRPAPARVAGSCLSPPPGSRRSSRSRFRARLTPLAERGPQCCTLTAQIPRPACPLPRTQFLPTPRSRSRSRSAAARRRSAGTDTASPRPPPPPAVWTSSSPSPRWATLSLRCSPRPRQHGRAHPRLLRPA